MIHILHGNIFDYLRISGGVNAVMNLCDCYGSISGSINTDYRVRYPGSYAAEYMGRGLVRERLGTVSVREEHDCYFINAFICNRFSDIQKDLGSTLFDPMLLYSCLRQITEVLRDYNISAVYLSLLSFEAMSDKQELILGMLNELAYTLPYVLNVVV